MESGERIEVLEEQYGTLTEQIGALTLQNQTILQQLGQLIQQSQSRPSGVPPPTPTTFPSPITPSTSADSTPNLKPSPPNEFTGDRAQGRAFLNSCELYIRLARKQFADEPTMVHWALSFMKSGRASLFAHRVLRSETRTGTPKFTTWADFRTTFTAEFCPKNETQLALAKLETSGYYQARRSVDEYVDDFRELIDQAGYKEGLAIVVKFRRGLQREIQDQIAQLAIGRPRDDDPEAWYDAAIRSDENRIANALFHGGTRSAPTPRFTSAFSTPKSVPTTQPSWQSRNTPASSLPRPTPTLISAPAPLDVDTTRRRTPMPVVCHRCGQAGHFVRECPKQYDVRFMSIEEREEYLQGWALQADSEELMLREEEYERSENEGKTEDFAERNR
jgi:hypothetical protein